MVYEVEYLPRSVICLLLCVRLPICIELFAPAWPGEAGKCTAELAPLNSIRLISCVTTERCASLPPIVRAQASIG